jgi:hypothetical protein
MPSLSDQERKLLGPLISAFEESKKTGDRAEVKAGESERDDFEEFIHDAIDDGRPEQRYVELSRDELTLLRSEGRYPDKCFLWVIDENSIKMIREKIRNDRRTHKSDCVCHTNLTANGKAFAGGELFFGEDGNVYVNPLSDRYGGERLLSNMRWETIVTYFRKVWHGKANVIDLLELMEAN